MKKKSALLLFIAIISVLLVSCSAGSEKQADISTIYAVTAAVSVGMLITCCFTKNKERWLFVLFLSVVIVNLGYYALSVSTCLSEALLANRISYFGSVFLPFSMFMIILRECGIKCPKWLAALLLGISFAVFAVTATPGYSDIYYKEVTFSMEGGVHLEKVYGAWHILYLFFLIGYFAAMISVIIRSALKKRIRSKARAALLLSAVIINIGVWLLEQVFDIGFEFLSVSYIMSEIFLIGLHYLRVEKERQEERANKAREDTAPLILPPECEYLLTHLTSLTQKERDIYELYVKGMRAKDICELLNIKENTLKYHNKNIYGKLGVTSRKQLVEVALKLPSSTD